MSGPIDLTDTGGFIIGPSKTNGSNRCNVLEQKENMLSSSEAVPEM